MVFNFPLSLLSFHPVGPQTLKAALNTLLVPLTGPCTPSSPMDPYAHPVPPSRPLPAPNRLYRTPLTKRERDPHLGPLATPPYALFWGPSLDAPAQSGQFGGQL